MKKLIIIISAVALTAVAQAAQVQWSATGITADPVNTEWTGYKLYLCDASVYTASVLASDLANGDFSKLSADGFVQATAGSVQQGTSAAAKIDATYKGGDYAAGSEQTFYTLVLNDAGSAATYFAISADVTKTTPSSGFLLMSFANVSANAQTAWTQTGAIPEPTSGLLLLLGMAGLALRRRHA